MTAAGDRATDLDRVAAEQRADAARAATEMKQRLWDGRRVDEPVLPEWVTGPPWCPPPWPRLVEPAPMVDPALLLDERYGRRP
jgi:hypothetical protein